MRRLVPAAVALGLAGCAAFRPPAPPPQAGLDQGMLIARVEVHGAVFYGSVKTVDLAQLEALDMKGAPVPGLRAQSGRAVNGYVVFFGLPAGRYVLRSASFPARGARYHFKIPQEHHAKRAVVLRPGAAAYMGLYRFDSRLPDFWVGVQRAGRIVFHWFTPFLRRPAIERATNLGVHESTPQLESEALLAVRREFKGTPWSRPIAARLKELGAPEPVKHTGMLLRRELPLRQEPFLAWRDTLDWGEPRRAADGIAWKRPGGEAQVAVFFTTWTAPGFLGWEASVAELRRESATSVEDRGGLFEVRVATRAGLGARVTKYRYPDGVLVGSETAVFVTETILVPDGAGQYTARLRAPRGEFKAALPAFREFLVQLVLGPPPPKAPPKQEALLPFLGGP
ncbi:MAG: hypothetical protein Q7J64_00825 [Elusimicrobiota bacterium]|nr:hypothetical protein [Elusimicrobiota bacterium]